MHKRSVLVTLASLLALVVPAALAGQPDPYALLGQLILPVIQTEPQVTTGDIRKAVRAGLEEQGEAALPALIEATYYGEVLTWEIAATLSPGKKLVITYQAEVTEVPIPDRTVTRVVRAATAAGVDLEVAKQVVEIRRGGKRAREPLRPGDIVAFKLVVRNTTGKEVHGFSLADVLFEGLNYVAGSTSGASTADPKIVDAAWVRWDAVNVLGNLASRDPQAVAPAVPALVDRSLRDINSHPRWRSLWALSIFPPEVVETEVLPRLQAGLEAEDPRLVWNTAVALAFFKQPEAVPILNQGVHEGDSFQRWEAIYCLAMVHNDESVPLLIAILSDPDEEVRLRQEAANTLGNIKDPRAIPALVAALRDPESGVRWRAAQALARLGDKSVIPALKEALAREEDEFAAQQIQHAIETLEGEG